MLQSFFEPAKVRGKIQSHKLLTKLNILGRGRKWGKWGKWGKSVSAFFLFPLFPRFPRFTQFTQFTHGLFMLFR